MVDGTDSKPGGRLFTFLILVGVAARFAVAPIGYNYDLISYDIVSDIVVRGGNFYAETERYNYGPIWALLLGAMRWIATWFAFPGTVFRLGIVAILTAADLAIAAILDRKFGARVALLFFLNPVSIVITGYHNQFDNAAIAICLAAVLLAQRAGREGKRRLWLGSLCLLGLSLTVKHIFFLFPLWLALRPGQRWTERLVAAALPPAIFAASFLPFLASGWRGILDNVFLYRSFNNGLLARHLGDLVPPSLLLVGALIVIGWLIRKRPLLESALYYLVVLVVFAPAMANQYLAIPMAAVAAAMNPFYALYAAVASLVVASNPDGLRLALLDRLGAPGWSEWLDGRTGYDLPVALLAAGLVWQAISWGRAAKRARAAESPDLRSESDDRA